MKPQNIINKPPQQPDVIRVQIQQARYWPRETGKAGHKVIASKSYTIHKCSLAEVVALFEKGIPKLKKK